MSDQHFQTNLKCAGCVAAIKPHLDALHVDWSVDLNHPQRLLTIRDSDASAEQVAQALEAAGYRAQPVAG